ncbi:MAG: putative metal-dependent hydrolase [Acidobacteriota bacterium]|nr:MAG: putative metal-dependent hydrolase [Acidobacteriota bacterium]
MSEDLRYPIGDFEMPSASSAKERTEWISTIRDLPGKIAASIDGLSEEQLDTPYRPGGWTVRQVVHHVADSHLNAYCRFKLALTEDNPTIKPYDEKEWAELSDSSMDPSVSLQLIDSVHSRFTNLLENMSESDFSRTLNHPETGDWELSNMLALYSWHSRHHTAHIDSLRERNGW